ncbi:MAG: NfeD family protein [Candidatus Caenarcaniphilales bacterium]|nr:NfeD family protein [Candidatus Caenarcaniphilales bacterium]
MIKYFITPSFWFALTLICLIFEILTPGFFLGTFAVSAITTSITAFFTKDFYIQISVFTVTSLLVYFFLRPIYLKYLQTHSEETKFGFSSLVGKVGEVTEPIETGKSGYIKIDGDQWRAFSETPIETGAQAKIVKVEGNTVWIEKQASHE